MFVSDIVLTLPRKDINSHQHIAHVTITEDTEAEMNEQIEDLRAEFPDLKVDPTK